jgi:SAM-dependent methyltransferase
LDIGGEPGRYAVWLAELGHRVVLADLSPELLAIAKARNDSSSYASRFEAVVEADARDLSAWQDDEFDAALSMGPFYHLPERSDRERAATELRRVVRPRSATSSCAIRFRPALGYEPQRWKVSTTRTAN